MQLYRRNATARQAAPRSSHLYEVASILLRTNEIRRRFRCPDKANAAFDDHGGSLPTSELLGRRAFGPRNPPHWGNLQSSLPPDDPRLYWLFARGADSFRRSQIPQTACTLRLDESGNTAGTASMLTLGRRKPAQNRWRNELHL